MPVVRAAARSKPERADNRRVIEAGLIHDVSLTTRITQGAMLHVSRHYPATKSSVSAMTIRDMPA
jgi:hypothetical protein